MSNNNLDYPPFSSFDEPVFPMVSYDVETIFSLDFNNTSDFFSPLTLLDAEEDELFGETGKELVGYRLSAVDMPDGVDRDTAFSIRSDHAANLSVQSGYSSTSDAHVSLGTWDSTVEEWGVDGALRVDMSDSNAFIMESNFGKITFDNDSTTRRLTADIYNLKIGTGSRYAEFQSLDTNTPALYFVNNDGDPPQPTDGAVIYAKGNDLYRRSSDGAVAIAAWGTGGGSGTIDTTADYSMTGAWSFSPASGTPDTLVPSFQPASAGAPFTIGSNGFDQVVSRLKSDTCVLADDSTLFNSQADTVFAKLADNETISGDYTFSGDSTFSGGVDFETTGASSIPEFNGNGNTSANPPFSLGTEAITATTVVTGLNSDRLDGYHSASFGKLGSADEVTADWEFSGQPDFTNGTVPFSVTSTAVVNNLKSDTCVLADNSTLLGGVAASTYPRNDNAARIYGQWTFEDFPIRMKQISAPSEPADTYAYLWYDVSDNGLWFRDRNTEGNHNVNLLTNNDADAHYSGTDTSSQSSYVTLLTLTPVPNQTYRVDLVIVGRGTAGDFDDGFVTLGAFNVFHTRTDNTLSSQFLYGQAKRGGYAEDGTGTPYTVGVGGSTNFKIPIEISGSNIVVKASGYNDTGSPNSFSWKYFVKVYQV
tara:strand:- start:2990 stop:4933 length:1944 start_codon:yes stop_codon:yes gene_type:complete